MIYFIYTFQNFLNWKLQLHGNSTIVTKTPHEYIRVTYDYIRVTYKNIRVHIDGILVHTGKIRVTYEYIQATYG